MIFMMLTDVSHSRNLFIMKLFEIRTERVQMLNRPAAKMFDASCFLLDQHQPPTKTDHKNQEDLSQAAAPGPVQHLSPDCGGITQQEPLSRFPHTAICPL